jgi:hypothetical protein
VNKLILYICWLSIALITLFSQASTVDKEVNHLITFIAHSDATFIRNGNNHTSTEAAEHLAMKYKKGKRYAKTADDFIKNLATKSAWSGKAYTVILKDGTQLTANVWLTAELRKVRNTEKPQ